MKIDLVHLRPSDELDKRNVSLSKMEGVSTVAIILGERLDADVLEGLSSAVLDGTVRLVSIYGEQSERLHDLVDCEALRRREPGEVVTTWDKEGGLADFVRTVSFVYRGVLDVSDQDRGILICYASDRKTVPEELGKTIDKIRNTSSLGRNGTSGH